MNVALWVAAGLLSAVFLTAGGTKLSQPREKLRLRMPWVDDFGDGQVRIVGTLGILGALGVVLPGVVKVAPILVPLAATGLGLLMVGATVVHGRRGETKQTLPINVTLLALAVVVAWGRFGPHAF